MNCKDLVSVMNFIDTNRIDVDTLVSDIDRVSYTMDFIKKMYSKTYSIVCNDIQGNEFNDMFNMELKVHGKDSLVLSIDVNLDVLNKYCYLDNFLDFGNKEDSKDYNDIVNVIQNTMVYSRKFFVSVY